MTISTLKTVTDGQVWKCSYWQKVGQVSGPSVGELVEVWICPSAQDGPQNLGSGWCQQARLRMDGHFEVLEPSPSLTARHHVTHWRERIVPESL